MSELKDIAGHVIEPGDMVVYPQMSGRAVQMVLGVLVSYNGKTAQIQRTDGTRWRTGYQTTKYRDTRTGKNISIYASDKHWATLSHYTYVHQVTGEELSEQEFQERLPLTPYTYYLSPAEQEIQRQRQQYKPVYHGGTLKDYVEKYEAPLPTVTIYNVSNLVKVVPA